MAFTLREHQNEMHKICGDILAGKKPVRIIASVKPGGGKSALPVILADSLIPAEAARLLWVVPRNALKYQGEEEFTQIYWNTPNRIRASVNEVDPCRGLQGYITTYQAIGQNPGLHQEEIRKHKYIVFLDEPHHVAEGSEWEKALAPIIEHAWLQVFASGTFSRGDGKKIAFLGYNGLHIDLNENPDTRVIRYTMKKGLQDKAILPYRFKMLDGAAKWEEKGKVQAAKISTKNEKLSSRALFTALRTEYAYQLLDAAIMQWQNDTHEFMNEYYDIENERPKLLVVSPDIEHAILYNDHLKQFRIHSKIATSDDTENARRNIEDFKKGPLDVLVTVAMAYEGLSVKPITAIAALTGIRSIPWLEQMFARGNRLCEPWKEFCTIFIPNDVRIIKAITAIEQEQLQAITEQVEEKPKGEMDPEEVPGASEPWINPLNSNANDYQEYKPEISFITPSTQEEILKTEIRNIRDMELSRKSQGAEKLARDLFYKRIRLICNKTLDEMTIIELTKVWMKLRELYL